jgi:hypothetical protein
MTTCTTNRARSDTLGKISCLSGIVRSGCALMALLTASCHRSDADDQQAMPAQNLTVTANELWSRYRENDVGADAMYAGADLQVTGTVTGIELGGTDRPVVLLASPDDSLPVRAEMSPDARAKAATLNDGDQAVLRCRSVSELAKAPMLRNCDF